MPQQNLSPTLDPTPLPQPSPVAVQTAQQMYQTPPDPQQYYGGKTGAIADIANHVLTGWMSGKYLGEQKAREKAAETVGTLNHTTDSLGKVYSAALESGDKEKIDRAYKDLKQQWDETTEAMSKYAEPPDMGQKKGVGGKIKAGAKAMFSPQSPELFPQAALAFRKKISENPDAFKDLWGPSKKDQQESKLADLQVAGAERANEKEERRSTADKRYEEVLQKPDKDMKPEDKKFRDTYEQMYLGKTKEQLFEDQILDKITSGQPLNEFERTKAEQLGLLKPAVTSTQVHTIMGPKGQPVTQLIAIGPDGKMVGQPQSLPGTDYVPPDQAQMAGRVINSEVSAYARLLGKAHPEWDEQTRYSMALGQVAKGTGMDWALKNQQQDVMNRALLKMIQSHTKTYKDSDGNPVREYDDEGNALMSHFVTSSDDGRYTWNASLGAPESHWFGPDTYGPYSQQQLQQYDKQTRAELRAILKEQNKGLSDTQIDQMMPAAGFGQKQGQPGAGQQAGGQAGMQPAPGRPGQGTPPNLGEGKDFQPGTYTATAPDGSVIASDLSQSQKDFMENDPKGKGLKFTLNSDPNRYGPGMVP